jgi:redox-sensitive bicupin YhaK (pirin superfamily)
MFPLLREDDKNTMELFQIWLNLPKAKKLTDPYFSMLWNEDIPNYNHKDSNGLETRVKVVAGKIAGVQAPPPTPDSWAAGLDNEVAIWLIRMNTGAKFILPPASAAVNRTIYFYSGKTVNIAGQEFDSYNAIELFGDKEVEILNGNVESWFLLLQGKPIGEPVVQYGPFVMNTQAEIQQAFQEYQQTQFGGWPWPGNEHVHAREKGRFAKYPDGKIVER